MRHNRCRTQTDRALTKLQHFAEELFVRHIVVDLEIPSLFAKRKQRVDPVSSNCAILVAKAMQQIDDSRSLQACFAVAPSECFLQQNVDEVFESVVVRKIDGSLEFASEGQEPMRFVARDSVKT